MTPPLTYVVAGERSSPRFGRAFAQGCRGRLTTQLILHEGSVAGFWSPPAWPVLRAAMADGRDFYYGDHAYFGRGAFFRITKNAYQHDGRGRASSARFDQFGIPIAQWQRGGRHIVVCPNSPAYGDLHGVDMVVWAAHVVRELQRHTDRPVRVRWKTDTQRPLAADLVDAWACVVFSSVSALYALAAGVPVISLAPFAASARMGLAELRCIESPLYPDDRESFFAVLAHQQWTLSEISAGHAWRALQSQGASRAA